MKLLQMTLGLCIILLMISNAYANTADVINTGNYIYENYGYTGGLSIRTNNNTKAPFLLSVQTVHEESLHTCDFEGICTWSQGILLCQDPNDVENIVQVRSLASTLELSTAAGNPLLYCGNAGHFLGKYTLCADTTLSSGVVTGVVDEILMEGWHGIGLLLDDGRHFTAAVPSAELESYFDYHEKRVRLEYTTKQYFDTYSHMCVRDNFVDVIVVQEK